MNTIVLPCLRMWKKDAERTQWEPGICALRGLVERRFSPEGLERFFGPKPVLTRRKTDRPLRRAFPRPAAAVA